MNGAKITLDRAIEFALEKAGVSAASLYTKNAAYDYENEQYVIDVEIDTKDTEYEAKINAVSGEIIKWKSKNDRKNVNINLTGVISLDRAIEIVIIEIIFRQDKSLQRKQAIRNFEEENGLIEGDITPAVNVKPAGKK